MTRVVFVVESIFPLGSFRQLTPLLSRLASESFELHVISLKDSKDELNSGQELKNIQLHGISTRERPFNAISELREILAKLDFDWVHGWGTATHLPVMLATVGFSGNRIFTYFEAPENHGLLNPMLLKVLGRASDVHVISHGSIFADFHSIQPIVIPNSLSPPTSPSRSYVRERLLAIIGETNKSTFLAGTVSRFEPRHRLKDLIWALDLLCCIRDDVHLLIFGRGNKTDLKKFISKTVASDRIHFVGPGTATKDDIIGLDVYWNSQREIPNPTPLLDSMSYGIPTVSVLDESNNEVVIPMKTAMATNFGAKDEFARWTKYVIEQPELAKQLAAQGKAHVEKLFATSTTVEMYFQLYSEA